MNSMIVLNVIQYSTLHRPMCLLLSAILLLFSHYSFQRSKLNAIDTLSDMQFISLIAPNLYVRKWHARIRPSAVLTPPPSVRILTSTGAECDATAPRCSLNPNIALYVKATIEIPKALFSVDGRPSAGIFRKLPSLKGKVFRADGLSHWYRCGNICTNIFAICGSYDHGSRRRHCRDCCCYSRGHG